MSHRIHFGEKSLGTDLPAPVLNIMLEYNKISYFNFFNGQANTNLLNMHDKILAEHRPLIRSLLQHIVRGEYAQAEKIIKENPEFLLVEEIAIDYSNRVIKGTALQMALGAEDINIQEAECMVEMILRYLKTLDDADSIIAKQIEKQFPKNFEVSEKIKYEQDLAALNKIFLAITETKEGDACSDEIDLFKNYFLEQSNKEITHSWHFNVKLLGAAIHRFHQHHAALGGDDSQKNQLLWIHVIGFLQRFVPACYAQLFCQTGVYNLFETNQQARYLGLSYSRLKAFYPLDSNYFYRLGYECAVHPGNASAQTTGAGWSIDQGSYGLSIIDFVEKKRQRCLDVCNTYRTGLNPFLKRT